jgi:hypothetical protein
VVTVGSLSATRTVGVQPESVLSLGLGGGYYFNSADCFHLPAGSGSEKYIIGVYSSSESPTSITPYTQTAITGTTLAGEAAPDFPIVNDEAGYFQAPLVALGDRPVFTSIPPQELPIEREYDPRAIAHAEAELRQREADLRLIEELGTGPQVISAELAATRASLPPRSVGDTIAIKMPNASCTVYDSISTVVRHVGTTGLYLEDLGNPLDTSFTAAEYATWDVTFSGTTLPKIIEYFGDLSDNVGFGLDDDGRVAVVVTKEANRRGGILGVVQSADLYPTSTCASSNYAEVFYAIAPDPDSVYGTIRTKSYISDLMPALIAHETTHILQFTQTIHGNAASKAVWELEGGATLTEWLVGNEVLGHGGAGQNVGRTEYLAGSDWYSDLHNDLARYFGYGSSKVAGAPEECTWLEREPQGPCGGGDGEWTRSVYGTPALLLRFILDLYGPTYPGGEAALMRALWSSAQTGYENLYTTTGENSIHYIQTLFGLNLYSDGRAGVFQGTWTSKLTYWDFTGIMSGYVSRAQLEPYTSSAAEPTSSHSVRGGSTAYLEWSPPSSHAPTSLRFRTPDGDELPNVIGVWIFRIQ